MSKFIFLILVMLVLNCGGVESERSYCEKRADYYFTLCLININITPDYYARPEWKTPTVKAYAQNYCILEFLRKKRCVDKSSIEPHRKSK